MNFENIKLDYAQIGDMRLHFATAGSGEKLVILLHGFPEFWYSWRHQIVALSDEFTVVAPDLRGYNLSGKPAATSNYVIDKSVDDVLGLMRFFGRERANIVGHDWGAGVAWATAARHPEAIEKLVALQVPLWAAWQQNAGWRQYAASWYMFFFQIPRLPEWILSRNDFALLERMLRADGKDFLTETDIELYKQMWRASNRMRGGINYYRANFWQRLFGAKQNTEKITVPTLFIYGEKDKFVLPETTRDIKRFIAALYLEKRFPRGSHWIQQEESTAVTAALRDFLRQEF